MAQVPRDVKAIIRRRSTSSHCRRVDPVMPPWHVIPSNVCAKNDASGVREW